MSSAENSLKVWAFLHQNKATQNQSTSDEIAEWVESLRHVASLLEASNKAKVALDDAVRDREAA